MSPVRAPLPAYLRHAQPVVGEVHGLGGVVEGVGGDPVRPVGAHPGRHGVHEGTHGTAIVPVVGEVGDGQVRQLALDPVQESGREGRAQCWPGEGRQRDGRG